jgi:hypothetical protein
MQSNNLKSRDQAEPLPPEDAVALSADDGVVGEDEPASLDNLKQLATAAAAAVTDALKEE